MALQLKGDSVMVEYSIPGDALYTTHAWIGICATETFALQIETLWERAQQREFVRISAYGLQVRVVRSQPSQFEDESSATQPSLFGTHF